MEKESKPSYSCSTGCKGSIFGLSTWSRNCRLSLWGPWDTVGSQKNTIPICASSCVYASRPISITKTSETKITLLEKPDSMLHVPFKYLRMRLTARKSALVGAWKCWQALFTACTILGLVKVKYWRDPTSCLYRVGSIGCSSEGMMMDLRAMGVLIWVHSFIFVCSRGSLVYFVWETNNPLGRYLTSNLKNNAKILSPWEKIHYSRCWWGH